jgi:opacity protein-like surface antigen
LLYPVKPDPWWDLPSGQSLTVAGPSGDGVYAGAQAGHDSLNLHTRGGRDQGIDEGEFSDTGTNGGLFAGYGLSRKRWYAGLEGDYEDSTADSHHSKAKSSSRTMTVSKGDSYGVALRGGYRLATGPLLYLRVGAQRTEFDSHYTVNATPDAGDDDQATQTGLRLGVGADIPAGDALFVRLDYSHTRYDDFQADIVDALGQAQTERIRPREDLFRVGLGWQWGRKSERRAHWTIDYNGLYAGAHIGQGALQSDASGLHNDGNTTPADPGPFRFVGDFGDDSAATGGVFFGYGYTRSRFYLGLEGELEDSNADWSHTREPGGRDFSVEKMETWGASLRGGYVLENGALLYVRAGTVRTRFNTTWVKGNNVQFAVDRDDRKSGNRLGVGAELPLSRDAFVRLDYTYTNYAGYDFVTGQAAADSMEFDNTESLFRLGAGVRF